MDELDRDRSPMFAPPPWPRTFASWKPILTGLAVVVGLASAVYIGLNLPPDVPVESGQIRSRELQSQLVLLQTRNGLLEARVAVAQALEAGQSGDSRRAVLALQEASRLLAQVDPEATGRARELADLRRDAARLAQQPAPATPQLRTLATRLDALLATPQQ